MGHTCSCSGIKCYVSCETDLAFACHFKMYHKRRKVGKRGQGKQQSATKFMEHGAINEFETPLRRGRDDLGRIIRSWYAPKHAFIRATGHRGDQDWIRANTSSQVGCFRCHPRLLLNNQFSPPPDWTHHDAVKSTTTSFDFDSSIRASHSSLDSMYFTMIWFYCLSFDWIVSCCDERRERRSPSVPCGPVLGRFYRLRFFIVVETCGSRPTDAKLLASTLRE